MNSTFIIHWCNYFEKHYVIRNWINRILQTLMLTQNENKSFLWCNVFIGILVCFPCFTWFQFRTFLLKEKDLRIESQNESGFFCKHGNGTCYVSLLLFLAGLFIELLFSFETKIFSKEIQSNPSKKEKSWQ